MFAPPAFYKYPLLAQRSPRAVSACPLRGRRRLAALRCQRVQLARQPPVLRKQRLGLVEGGLALGAGFLQALFVLRSLSVKGNGKLLLLRMGTL